MRIADMARYLTVGVLATLFACTKSSSSDTEVAVTPGSGERPGVAPAAPEPAREPSLLEQLLAKDSLAEAIEQARPLMTDTFDETSPGAAMLALWAAKKLRWVDVEVKKNETTFARIRKDAETNRGKRMCFRGRIVQIAKDASSGDPVFLGLMLIGYSEIARFLAVADTGDLVERSRARFCGVVIGTYDYSNSAGGTGHAITFVGMFDLPENRTRFAE